MAWSHSVRWPVVGRGRAAQRPGAGLAALTLLAAIAGASPRIGLAQQQGAVAADDPSALLGRIQQAARKLDYSGVFTYQQGAFIQSSRVVHVIDGTGERERLEVLDGEPREFVRHNDEVHCIIPEKKTVLVERRRGDRFPGLLLGEPKDLGSHYRIRIDEALHRVAGRECRLIRIDPLDDRRYGYKLCADAQTDLLLKAQTLSPSGVIEQVAFTSLLLGPEVESGQLESKWSTRDWKMLESDMKPVDLAAKGWRIPAPPGFVQVLEVARGMGKAHKVSQLVLSDGLAAISVFIEPYDSARGDYQPRGAAQRGAINLYGARVADYWLTVLGEVPPGTLRQLAESIEYVPLAPAP